MSGYVRTSVQPQRRPRGMGWTGTCAKPDPLSNAEYGGYALYCGLPNAALNFPGQSSVGPSSATPGVPVSTTPPTVYAGTSLTALSKSDMLFITHNDVVAADPTGTLTAAAGGPDDWIVQQLRNAPAAITSLGASWPKISTDPSLLSKYPNSAVMMIGLMLGAQAATPPPLDPGTPSPVTPPPGTPPGMPASVPGGTILGIPIWMLAAGGAAFLFFGSNK